MRATTLTYRTPYQSHRFHNGIDKNETLYPLSKECTTRPFIGHYASRLNSRRLLILGLLGLQDLTTTLVHYVTDVLGGSL